MSYKNLLHYTATKRHAVCPVCNQRIENDEPVWRVPNSAKNANGGVAYVHADHTDPERYHGVADFTNPANYRGNLGKDGLLFGIELEVCARTDYPIMVDGVEIECPDHALAYIASIWQLRWTNDITVYAEGNMPPETKMNGWRDRIARTLWVLAPNHASAGAHLTIGWAVSRDFIPNFGYNAARCMLSYFASEILANETDNTIKSVFGRSFTHYAEYTDESFEHGYWANIRGNGSIEFRLCHIDNVEQWMRGATFCAEFCKIIKALDKDELSISKAFQKVDKLWNKTINRKLAVETNSKYGNELDRKRDNSKKVK